MREGGYDEMTIANGLKKLEGSLAFGCNDSAADLVRRAREEIDRLERMSAQAFRIGVSNQDRIVALEEAIHRTRTRLERYCNEVNAGRMPSDAREFMRRVQLGFDSLMEEANAITKATSLKDE